MKFNKIFASIAAAVATLASCTVEGPTYLDEVKVDCSYVALPEEGGSKTVKLTATTDWQFEETPEWLTVAPASGAAGEFDVVFTATALSEHQSEQEANFNILANGKKVGMRVCLGAPVSIANTKATAYTADKAIELYLAGKDLGAEIYVKGVVTKASIDLSYGNAEFYLEENSEDYDFEFYRCMDIGNKKFTDDKKVKVGDTIIAKGTLTIYKSTIELGQGCELVEIVKADLDLTNADDLTIGKEGGEVTALFTVNGGNFNFNVLDDFLSVKEVKPGTEGATEVVISVLPNDGGAREGQIEFTSGKAKLVATVTQEGGLSPISEIELNQPCAVKGQVTALCARGFILTDETASVLYYQSSGFDPSAYKIGDTYTVMCSKVTSYGGAYQLDASNVTALEKVSEGTYNYPTATEMDKAALDAFVGKSDNGFGQLITFTAKASISNYYNYFLADGDTNGFSLYQGTDDQKALFKNGETYTITGYLISRSSGKYANFVLVEATEAGAKNYPSAQTSWRYDIPGDSDGGFMIITFIDDTNCYMASGDKEGIWWDPADGFFESTYTYDPVENLGVAFGVYSLQMTPEGKLSVYGGAFIMHQVTYIPIPEN